MREKVAIFYVDDKEYRIVCKNNSAEISVEYMVNYDFDLKKMDFILICHDNKYILKNFVHIDGKKLRYTSGIKKMEQIFRFKL